MSAKAWWVVGITLAVAVFSAWRAFQKWQALPLTMRKGRLRRQIDKDVGESLICSAANLVVAGLAFLIGFDDAADAAAQAQTMQILQRTADGTKNDLEAEKAGRRADNARNAARIRDLEPRKLTDEQVVELMRALDSIPAPKEIVIAPTLTSDDAVDFADQLERVFSAAHWDTSRPQGGALLNRRGLPEGVRGLGLIFNAETPSVQFSAALSALRGVGLSVQGIQSLDEENPLTLRIWPKGIFNPPPGMFSEPSAGNR